MSVHEVYLSDLDEKCLSQGLFSLLADMSTALALNDLQAICRALSAYTAFRDEIAEDFKLPAEITSKVESSCDTIIKWVNTIKTGDRIDIYDGKHDDWFEAKVIQRNGNILSVHYIGFGTKKAEHVDITQNYIYPGNTITYQRVKAKRSTTLHNADPTDSVERENVKEANRIDRKVNLNDEESIIENGGTTKQFPIVATSSGRVVKQVKQPFGISITVAKKPATSERKKPRQKVTDFGGREVGTDVNEWLCGVCWQLENNGSELILCDGPCLRSFHIACLKAAEFREDVASIADDSESKWLCNDCTTGYHKCFICNIYGRDSMEVCKCVAPNCGKHYHATCLLTDTEIITPEVSFASNENATSTTSKITSIARSNVKSAPSTKKSKTEQLSGEYNVSDAAVSAITKDLTTTEKSVEDFNCYSSTIGINGQGSKKGAVKAFSFRCPYHVCHTCYEFYPKEKAELLKCVYCPRSFHNNCIPPGARFNTICVVCPRHLDKHLPSEHPNATVNLKNNSNSSSTPTSALKPCGTSVWDQMVLSDILPNPTDVMDNHFCLPTAFREDAKAEPRPFKYTSKLIYDKTAPVRFYVGTTEESICHCKDVCGSSCHNKHSRIECTDSICGVGGNCGNRRLQYMEYIDSERFQEFEMGWGLRSKQRAKADTLVIEYVGEVINHDEVKRRLWNQRLTTPSDRDYYIMALENNAFVDGKHYGNEARFINHSCDPNCELQLWQVDGRMRIGIVTIREVQPNEPLSYDYQFDTSEEESFKCYCKTKTCRGTMAPKRKIGQVDLNDLNERERRQVIAQYRRKNTRSQKELIEDELSRCYTGKKLPGDSIHEIKNGPQRSTFKGARENRIFLPRNTL